MSDTTNDYTAGRSLFAELADLREQMTALKAAMLQLVELQREMHQTLVAAMNVSPITNGETPAQVV